MRNLLIKKLVVTVVLIAGVLVVIYIRANTGITDTTGKKEGSVYYSGVLVTGSRIGQ